MKKTHLLYLFSAFATLAAASLTAQNEQPKEFKNNNYQINFLAKNELGRAYGLGLGERSGLRELSIQGKVYLQQYYFSTVLVGKNIPSTPKTDTKYTFNGKNFNTKKMLIDVNTGKEFAELNTDAVFSENSYTVTHTLRPFGDFIVKPEGQTDEVLVLPIENVKLAAVTAWTSAGKTSAIFPTHCTKENWGMNGRFFNKLEINTNDIVITITKNENTLLRLNYQANYPNKNPWKNPMVGIRPAWGVRDKWTMKKDVPLVWGYTVSIEKVK